ncbi:MAG: PQQ-dependent sugar dehydrogenase [Deltaproteobacteria bacterium]|nr:PQQ-dependent sugar dehydrogenase [Candidatus Deferrimicrobium borealis]
MRFGVSDAGGPIETGAVFSGQAGGARIRAGFRSLIAVLAFLVLAGCGGSSSTAPPPPPGPAPGAAPVLSVTPGSLAFTGQAGDANPASQTMSVTNAGGGTLPWAASGNAPWLSATPSSGVAPSTVSVSVDISGLAAGTYNGTVTITSAGASGSPNGIPVSLTVTAPPPGPFPQISLAVVAGGFASPVHVTHAGDGSGRIFVVEQAGRIRILDNGAVLPVPFLDLASLIPPRLVAGGEQGLLSVAFPPGFAAKRYFYVNYTRAPDGATVVARYRVSAGDANVADPASEEVILTIPQPFVNHNGGQLAFGPDGYLYIGTGDGGSGGDPLGNGQNPGAFLGKLLRIDVESGAAPYGVPAGNPFVANANFLPEIWALGVRNPWRFSFDRGTGDLYIGDVGQGNFEEIDFQPAGSAGGQNYGWNLMEGDSCYPFGTVGCNRTGLALPVFVYDHGLGCSVTGGHVYRGSAFPSLQGVYLFGDLCSGRIWGIRKNGVAWDNAVLADNTGLTITTFGEDEAGNVYVVNYANGDLLKILSP